MACVPCRDRRSSCLECVGGSAYEPPQYRRFCRRRVIRVIHMAPMTELYMGLRTCAFIPFGFFVTAACRLTNGPSRKTHSVAIPWIFWLPSSLALPSRPWARHMAYNILRLTYNRPLSYAPLVSSLKALHHAADTLMQHTLIPLALCSPVLSLASLVLFALY
ncbi:hypothetical protein GY45DRAFT_777314 [Cubamyces sp. BRFM 1775]|nr:hypothetical protein GY45DRAFT_777314 [Cubamyces sp. BRFM 1775]